MTITVLIFKYFYCIVLEKMNGKFTPKNSAFYQLHHYSFENAHKNISFIGCVTVHTARRNEEHADEDITQNNSL